MPEPKRSPDGPASAPDATPETISAVLAEMRDTIDLLVRLATLADVSIVTQSRIIREKSNVLLSQIDRIEAAAERERDEDRRLAAIAESDEAFARCARCDRPERAPGNAAALREALERIDKRCRLELENPINESDPTGGLAMCDILAIADDALSTPARNCDRFATAEDARRAFEAAHSRGIVHNLYPASFDWLFATVEGGDHA